MAAGVPRGHPLSRLLSSLIERNFTGHLGWPDAEVIGYLAGVMTDFVHVDQLFKIRNAQGRRVEEVAEMLVEGDLLHRAQSVEREREVHKHVGDYTLFMSGIFPEFLHRLKTTRTIASPDALLDLMQVGKRSYRIVSEFTYGPHGESAPLYRKLSENFELCVYGLGYVRADLDRLRDPRFQAAKGRLLG
ncbi:MAG TPA: hypothetical protein VLT62_18395 [Candidatus Methylomirabilis sp.]|nr:hypothetical protein [Candidatus Methylomirabilis sp.]